MVNHTRLDCVIGTAARDARGASRRRPATRAHRSAFGKLLADQPLMRNVLADLAIESEAATALAMRLARAYDEPPTTRGSARSSAWPPRSAKYWVCKRAPAHAAEALECLGGNGYVEESRHAAALPRGAAELDLGGLGQRHRARRAARADAHARGSLEALLRRGRAGRGRRRAPGRVRRAACATSSPTRGRSRRARAGSSSAWRSRCRARCCVRHAPPAVADAFCASRLGGDGGLEYGTLPAGHGLRGDRRAPHAACADRRPRRTRCATIGACPDVASVQLARIFGIRIGVEPRAGSSCCSC